MAQDPLMRPAIFLSAGVPNDPGRGSYVDTADPIAIRDAVRAAAAVVLNSGRVLVFGGQPAITPLVAQIAESIGKLESVVIYQSDWFRGATPKEVAWFRNLRWTEKKDDVPASLLEMRRRMLTAPDLRYEAAVFIGGMNGVEDEQALFAKLQPGARQYPVASTGGAALNLWKKLPADDSKRQDALREDVQYQSLFEEVIG